MKILTTRYNLVLLVCMSMFLYVACSSDNSDPEPEPEITANCNDGLMNGIETGVDCGGNCQPCPIGLDVTIPTAGFTSPASYTDYELVWSDEFNDDNLSTEKWSYHLGDGCPNLCGWGNNELQNYFNTTRNLFFKEGNLVIGAKHEGGADYSSSRIHTDNKFEFQYGRVDIRASMPSAVGSWVALWLLNHNYIVDDPGAWWPNGGEIDIMEYLGENTKEVFGTAHYGANLASHTFNSKKYAATGGNYDEAYYVFSIIWEEDKITWLVNDVEYHSFTPAQTNGQPYPFNDEFYLIMNLSVGGNLPVAPIATDYPTYLIIDYIRVFQKK